jgi:hypothetical protein
MRSTTMAIRGAIAGAGLLILALLAYPMLRADPAPTVQAQAVLPAPPPAIPTPPLPPPVQAPVQAPDISGLSLHGLLASGAILGFAGGSQRLVPIGREALPGLTLRRIEQNHAVFASAAGEVRLGFDGPAEGTPGAAPAPRSGDETLPYRLGLVARPSGGFTLRPGADLPALARAGIRPGDAILSVNGSRLDEERMLELPWQIANSTRTEFEVERAGRRMRLALPAR